MTDWVGLDATRVMKRHDDGFIVVRPSTFIEPAPIFCHVCNFPSMTIDDGLSFRKDGCCARCSLVWADPNRDMWSNGWRPTPEQIRLDIIRRRIRPQRLPFSSR